MGTKMSLSRRNKLEETKKGLDTLSNLIQKVLDGNVTQAEAANELGISPQQWSSEANNMFMGRLHKMQYLSYEDMVNLLRLCVTPYEKLAYDIFGVPEESVVIVLSEETENILKEIIEEQLDDRYKKVITLYYGLNNEEPKTLIGVGKELGVSAERVRQLLCRALRKMRNRSNCVRLLPSYREYIQEIQNASFLKDLNLMYDEELKSLRSIDENINKMGLPISTLNLSTRTYNALKKYDIDTVAEILNYSSQDLLKIRNFGRSCLNELKEKLGYIGLHL